MTIYLTDDAFSVKAKRFNKMFTSILALFFLLRIANKSHLYAPNIRICFSSIGRQRLIPSPNSPTFYGSIQLLFRLKQNIHLLQNPERLKQYQHLGRCEGHFHESLVGKIGLKNRDILTSRSIEKSAFVVVTTP